MRPGRLSQPGPQAVVVASLVATVGVLPVFLLGALAVLVRSDLAFTESQLGIAVSVYFLTAALASVPSGRLVEALGGRVALVLAAVASGVALAGLASARSWAGLLAWLVVGGVANALSQLAANLMLSGSVSRGHQGLAFGIKQSAIPAATLIGGVAVPMIGLTLGWRWVFGITAAVALLLALAQGRAPRSPRAVGRPRAPRARLTLPPLVVLAGAGVFGAAAATAMASFVVEYAVTVGVRPGMAGLVLAAGSAASIGARLAMGWRADRRAGDDHLRIIATMLAVGAVAVASFPLARATATVAAVAVVAYAVGWGWPGLFNYTVVRRHPQGPATATGITQVGVYVGGVIGPATFGLLVEHAGYTVAWRTAGASLAAAAALMLAGRALDRRSAHAQEEPPASGRR